MGQYSPGQLVEIFRSIPTETGACHICFEPAKFIRATDGLVTVQVEAVREQHRSSTVEGAVGTGGAVGAPPQA